MSFICEALHCLSAPHQSGAYGLPLRCARLCMKDEPGFVLSRDNIVIMTSGNRYTPPIALLAELVRQTRLTTIMRFKGVRGYVLVSTYRMFVL